MQTIERTSMLKARIFSNHKNIIKIIWFCIALTINTCSMHEKPTLSCSIRKTGYDIDVLVGVGCYYSLPVITWYAIFTISPKCQQRTAIFAEWEVSLSRFLLMHTLYCWSDRPILCGNVIEFDRKKCLYSKSFRFYKHFDVSEKNMVCLAHQKKNIFATFHY